MVRNNNNNNKITSLHDKKSSSSSCLSFWKWCSPTALISHLCVAVMAFHSGLLAGYSSSSHISHHHDAHCSTPTKTMPGKQQHKPSKTRNVLTIPGDHGSGGKSSSSTSDSDLFPSTTSSFIVGMGLVSRDDFAAEINLGIPVDATEDDNQAVVLLYGPQSMPDDDATTEEDSSTTSTNGGIPLYRNVTQAMAQCHSLKVILTEPDMLHGCIAIMGQTESYHVQRFLRLLPVDNTGGGRAAVVVVDKTKGKRAAAAAARPPKKPGLNASVPLRYVSRQHREDGFVTKIPNFDDSIHYYKVLTAYLLGLQESLERLRPIAAMVANDHGPESAATERRPIVVLVCNFGQSELLMNFVCSARNRGLDLSQVLLFATDSDTAVLAKNLGLAVFEVGNAFGDMPKGPAKMYVCSFHSVIACVYDAQSLCTCSLTRLSPIH
jgi:hypothetical protein